MKDEKTVENKGKFGLSFLKNSQPQVEETPQVEEGGEPESEEEEENQEPDSKTEAQEKLEEVIGGEVSEEEAAKLAQMAKDVASIPEEGEKEPEWLEKVVAGIGDKDPSRVTDKELLKIKGIGKAILKQIREVYPYQEPKRSGKVMIEILPMRGIGGVGSAGTQAEMDWEQAEQYVQEGYVKILE